MDSVRLEEGYTTTLRGSEVPNEVSEHARRAKGLSSLAPLMLLAPGGEMGTDTSFTGFGGCRRQYGRRLKVPLLKRAQKKEKWGRESAWATRDSPHLNPDPPVPVNRYLPHQRGAECEPLQPARPPTPSRTLCGRPPEPSCWGPEVHAWGRG